MSSYQDMLRAEYARRQGVNASYSLRAFARDLGISQPFLSQLLANRRKLGSEKALLVSTRMKWNKRRRSLFVELARLDSIRDPRAQGILRETLSPKLEKEWASRTLSEDIFQIVSDWYYYALVELTSVNGFRPNASWISKRLKITRTDAAIALDRLKRVGLIVEKNGKWIKAEANYTFADIPSQALRKHHRQSLDLAQAALESQPMNKREFVSVTLALDPAQLPRAREKIREFYRELMNDLEAGPKTAVYKMSVQLFRLDQEQT